MKTELITVYSTFPSADDARRVARVLLDARLVACANIMPQGQSLYHWKGVIEDAVEYFVLFKTQAVHFKAVEDAIKAHHPYEVPCIVAWPITDGHAPFLQWIKDEASA